ncbi:hypothetical protein THAOC_28741, partial [Thalassiosira oceanica]
MEVDIYQNSSNPAAPAANFTQCTLLESNRQGSQSLPPPTMPSVPPTMPYERPIRRTLHDLAVPSVILDADDRSKLHADAALSALAKSKRLMKKKERPRNTRRQHSNPNRSINPNPSGDHEDDRHEHEREQPRLVEPDISPTSEPDICTTLDGRIQAVQHTPDPESITLHRPTYKPGDPFDPKAPRADPPQPGPSNLPARPPEQINRTVPFDEDEPNKACEPGEPFDPKAPRAEPLQPSPSNLPTRLPEQIHHTVPFDDNELDKACEPGEPFDPKAPRAEPLQPSPSNLPAGPSEQIDAHAPSPTTINASFNQVRDLQHYKG